MFTLPVILSGLTLILGAAVFQFGLFRWLIGRIDLLGNSFKEELIRHAQADLEVFKEVRNELKTLASTKTRKRVR